MRILVTGGAGYVGSILVPRLLELGHEVIVLDNFLYKQASLLDRCLNRSLTIVRGDSRNKDLLGNLVPSVDAIIPLACLVGAPLCDRDPVSATTVNRDAVLMLSRLRGKSQIMVFPMTNSGYGVGKSGVFCTEQSPLNPVSLYGRLKVDVEKELLEQGNAVSLRFATVFGASPRMRLDLLVNDFVYRAVTDRFVVIFEGNFKRNYLHIRDASDAFIHVLSNYDKMKGQSFNVGLSEANLSKLDLCAEIKKQIPDFAYFESSVGKDPDRRDYMVSNEKIEKTGFKAKVSLREGIAELIKAYQIIRENNYSNV
ncbi:MAG: NAD(P)-dependent oxidoreductase [Kiritimatiellae bacterium]|nr:NAD(P)-dependent oxidoreductase [Kiritimatiellia bacterium]MDD5521300.1 NAD(P)-dependent oxidoreductase [Kiritimatiellia bacterium]